MTLPDDVTLEREDDEVFTRYAVLWAGERIGVVRRDGDAWVGVRFGAPYRWAGMRHPTRNAAAFAVAREAYEATR